MSADETKEENSPENRDEYHFPDEDLLATHEEKAHEMPPFPEDKLAYAMPTFLRESSLRRNILITVVLIVAVMLTYKIVATVFLGKKQAMPVKQSAIPQAPEIPTMKIQEPVIDKQTLTNLQQKIASLETAQEVLRGEVVALHSQLDNTTTTLNTVLAKVSAATGVLDELTQKIELQAKRIEETALITQRQKIVVQKPVRVVIQYPSYCLQAIIPGRAWLLASNGVNITVRRGTRMAGYGVVTVIDPTQGRVVTSSGKVIRFSQNDS